MCSESETPNKQPGFVSDDRFSPHRWPDLHRFVGSSTADAQRGYTRGIGKSLMAPVQ